MSTSGIEDVRSPSRRLGAGRPGVKHQIRLRTRPRAPQGQSDSRQEELSSPAGPARHDFDSISSRPGYLQAVETQRGDNESELDAACCTSDGTRLYLALTGNLQNNFNKLEIFIDSKTGGENVLSGSPGNDNTGNMAGMGFDPGFTADYHIIVRRGFFGGDRFDLDFAELGTGNVSSYGDLFLGSLDGAGATGTGVNLSPILVGFNNSNTAGVLGGDGTGVFTGNIGFNLANFPGDPYFVCMDRAIPVEQTTRSRIKAIGR